MRFLNALAIAISMYSKIPAPTVDWNDKNMKICDVLFPVVGVVTGLLQFGAGYVLLTYTSCGKLLFAAVMTLIPVLVTGGIHLDGYADTIDALSSWGDREKKLEILKDPPYRGVCRDRTVRVLYGGAGPVERGGCCLASSGGVYVPAVPGAQRHFRRLFSNGEEQRAFEDFSRRRPPPAGPDRADPLGLHGCGPDVRPWPRQGGAGVAAAGLMIAAALLAFLYYYRMSRKRFGGTTGDLAGYFLQVCELAMLAAVIIGWNL